MSITFNQSRSDAIQYFKSLSATKIKQRFDYKTTVDDIDEIMNDICTTSKYLCAVEDGVVIGVLDYYLSGSNRKQLPVYEIALVVSKPGVGLTLLNEFKRLNPSVSIASSITGGSVKGAIFSFRHCDIVMIDIVIKIAKMIPIPHYRSKIIQQFGVAFDSEVDDESKRKSLLAKCSMASLYSLINKQLLLLMAVMGIDGIAKKSASQELHKSIFYKRGV